MRRKEFLRRASAISVAALLTMNLCACQKEEAVISEEEKARTFSTPSPFALSTIRSPNIR